MTALTFDHIDEDRRGFAVNAQRQALGQLTGMLEQARERVEQERVIAEQQAENARIREQAESPRRRRSASATRVLGVIRTMPMTLRATRR